MANIFRAFKPFLEASGNTEKLHQRTAAIAREREVVRRTTLPARVIAVLEQLTDAELAHLEPQLEDELRRLTKHESDSEKHARWARQTVVVERRASRGES